MSGSPHRVRAVLFDLDGTLLDTAPDMVAATNALLVQEARAPLSFERARCEVSHGSVALTKLAFPDVLDPVASEALRTRLLALYRARIATATQLFAGFDVVLEALEALGIPWGIVTNKPGWLTAPLLQELELGTRAACVVSGDTTPHSKPHPLPLLHAAQCIGVAPADCLYVGDAERDIAAGRAAGMRVLFASFGYLRPHDRPEAWGADGTIESPLGVLDWLGIDVARELAGASQPSLARALGAIPRT